MAKNICVVGVGRWGKNHVRTLAKLGCLGGFVEVRQSELKQLAGEFPDAKAFASIDDALAHGFDGYTIATPAESHFVPAKRIIHDNKPLLV